MVIAITLIVSFAVFYLLKRRIGPALLAIIAGLSIYDMFGANLAATLHGAFGNIPLENLSSLVYLCFVIAFPLVLYIRSKGGGMKGIIRLAESLVLAALVTTLLAPLLADFFTFDSMSRQIVTTLDSVRNGVVLASVVSAYLDILFFKG